LALFLEESLYRGTKWVVFEANDETTWSNVRLRVGSFMRRLFQKGAFQGRTPKDAYFVKCDPETTTERHRAGRHEHRRGLRAPQTCRIRGPHDPAGRRTDGTLSPADPFRVHDHRPGACLSAVSASQRGSESS